MNLLRRSDAMVLVLALVSHLVPQASAIGEGTRQEDQVRHILCERPSREGPSYAERVVAFSQREGLPLETISRILISLVKEGLNDDNDASIASRIAQRAASVLGDLKRAESLPVLEEMSRSPDQHKRLTAIGAAVRADPSKALLFAGEVAKKSDFGWRWERRTLFEALLSVVKQNPQDADVVRFLADSVNVETWDANIRLVDETLSHLSASYRTSSQRADALTKVSNSPAGEKLREYLERALDELRAVPKEERTDLGARTNP
jgi:hypothetical protein